MQVNKVIAVIGAILIFCAQPGWTQEALTKTDKDLNPINAYRVDFSVNEVEDGKTINSRQYSMNLNAGDKDTIKIGTRVPVEAKDEGGFQYLDVGTNISCRLNERANGLAVEVWADITNFAVGDGQNPSTRPVLRQMAISGTTIAKPGKRFVVGSVDDPNSKRQFQLEVLVTKLT